MFNVGIAGCTWDIYISKDGSNYEKALGEIVETSDSDGGYVFCASADDMDANLLTFLAIETNNDPAAEPLRYECQIVTEDPLTYNGAAYLNNLETILTAIYNKLGGEIWTYTMYEADKVTRLPGCTVRATLDSEGTVSIGEKVTDDLGQTRWLVDRGRTYYMWRSMTGWEFENPDIEVIDSVGSLSTSAFAVQKTEESVESQGYAKEIEEPLVYWSYRVFTDSSMTRGLAQCLVRLTMDESGWIVVDEKLTDTEGYTDWELEPGEYYVWRERTGYKFSNPMKYTISH